MSKGASQCWYCESNALQDCLEILGNGQGTSDENLGDGVLIVGAQVEEETDLGLYNYCTEDDQKIEFDPPAALPQPHASESSSTHSHAHKAPVLCSSRRPPQNPRAPPDVPRLALPASQRSLCPGTIAIS